MRINIVPSEIISYLDEYYGIAYFCKVYRKNVILK